MSTITITFGNAAENHKGMQIIGDELSKGDGFTTQNLRDFYLFFKDKEFICEGYNLSSKCPIPCEDAKVIVIKNGISFFTNPDKFLNEQISLEWDKKAFMYGRVVNKHARHNLIFSDYYQEADYENKKGTIIPYSNVPYLNQLKDGLEQLTNKKLYAEGNYYYDINKTFIGFHGDVERKIVIGARLGETFPLCYKWFINSEQISEKLELKLDHGDLYFMSEKAVGSDWKTRKIPTLRHAAGFEKNIN